MGGPKALDKSKAELARRMHMRHGSAKTTLDAYGHMWDDNDETVRAAIGGAITARPWSAR
jgi:hypothetical protein